MPNAHLRSSDFVAEENSTQADICKLKSKYHFLNSFAVDEDYEAALLTGRAQLKINSEECRLAMQARLKQISEVFFKQIDSIVDHYIERSLK